MSKGTNQPDNGESAFDIGRHLRSLRAETGLTLRELAKRSGVAFTTIQKIESGSISPTIGILMKIAGGLSLKITSLLEEETPSRRVHFIPKKERVQASGKGFDIEVQYVAQNLINPEILGFHITVGPGQGSGSDPLSHCGEEVAIGLQGVTRFVVDNEEFLVGPGDSLHFKSGIPHSWMNTGSKTSKFYLICSDRGLAPSPPDRI